MDWWVVVPGILREAARNVVRLPRESPKLCYRTSLMPRARLTAERSCRIRRSNMGNGDRHDVRYTDQERSTSNIQLATFNWVTEKAHGWQDMGTDTMFDIPTRNVQRETFNSQLSMG